MSSEIVLLKNYKKELIEALNKNDFEEFKKFYSRWEFLFPYNIPDEPILEITMHKTMCNAEGVKPEIRKQAKEWLKERGFSIKVRTKRKRNINV